MGMRILGTLNGMHQITFIVDNVHDQLAKKLSQIDKETLSMPQLLHQHCQIEQKDAREIVEILRKEDIIQLEENNNTTSLDHALHHLSNVTLKELNPLTFHHEYVNPLAFDTRKEFKTGINQLSKEQYNPIVSEYRYHKIPKTTIEKVDLFNHNRHRSKVVDFCASLNKNTLSVQIDDLSQIMKSVSDVITDQVIRITESQLISPWSSYGMGALTNAISSNIQDKIIQSQLTGEMKSIDEQLKDIENKENKTPEDINKIKELKADLGEKQNLSNTTQTYSGLINHEAKKYTIAYSQCENIHYAQQRDKNSTNTNNQVSKEVKSHAEAVKKDKPADIADMFTMATENGIDLKIVDDPNYQLTEEEKAKGTKIVVFTKGDKDIEGKEGIGHYQLLSSDGKLIDIPTNGNDCGYAVFAELTGKSVEQLRNETAQGIEANSNNFSKAIEAQNWIQDRYPQEANTLLFEGAGPKRKITKLLLDKKSNNEIKTLINEHIDSLELEEKEKIKDNFNKLKEEDIKKAAIIFIIMKACEEEVQGARLEILKGGHVFLEDKGEMYNLLKEYALLENRNSSHHPKNKTASDASFQVGNLFPEVLFGKTQDGKTWFQLENSPWAHEGLYEYIDCHANPFNDVYCDKNCTQHIKDSIEYFARLKSENIGPYGNSKRLDSNPIIVNYDSDYSSDIEQI
jgi:hypothetical protein